MSDISLIPQGLRVCEYYWRNTYNARSSLYVKCQIIWHYNASSSCNVMPDNTYTRKTLRVCEMPG